MSTEFNIQVFIPQSVPLAARLEQERAVLLAHDHREGKHPYGSMRRDCPLCQRGPS